MIHSRIPSLLANMEATRLAQKARRLAGNDAERNAGEAVWLYLGTLKLYRIACGAPDQGGASEESCEKQRLEKHSERREVLRALGRAVPAEPQGEPLGSGPPSADVLYSNCMRDIVGGKYDLARQEFQDYLKSYPETDLASNAQFYLGEIAYAQKQYKEAIVEYDKVIENYPKSLKLAPARLKKAMALLELGQKASAIRELRDVMRLFPGTEEERRARAKLELVGPMP